jgi:hypothetical protein
MHKAVGIALAGLLALSSVAPALAQTPDDEAVSNNEDVLGVQARQGYLELAPEVRIDLLRALIARGQLLRDQARTQAETNGEAVLGEEVHRGDVTDEQMQQMLQQLQARASIDAAMPR